MPTCRRSTPCSRRWARSTPSGTSGDVVGYGPHPDEVVARLREIGAGGVRGNHDEAALGRLDVHVLQPGGPAGRGVDGATGSLPRRAPGSDGAARARRTIDG